VGCKPPPSHNAFAVAVVYFCRHEKRSAKPPVLASAFAFVFAVILSAAKDPEELTQPQPSKPFCLETSHPEFPQKYFQKVANFNTQKTTQIPPRFTTNPPQPDHKNTTQKHPSLQNPLQKMLQKQQNLPHPTSRKIFSKKQV
jgi:hypothetical protein